MLGRCVSYQGSCDNIADYAKVCIHMYVVKVISIKNSNLMYLRITKEKEWKTVKKK